MSRYTILLLTLSLSLYACDSKKADQGDHGEHGDHAHGNSTGAKDGDTDKAAAKKGDAKKDDHAGHDHAGHDHGKADPDAIPGDQSGEGLTRDKKFFVTFTPSVNPIPFQEPFALDVTVYEPKDHTRKIESVSIDSVRALMPAHKHGMKVEPKVTKVSPGVFKIEGMRFHMQGAGDDGKWVLELGLNDGKTVDLFTYDLQCCR